MKYWIIVSRWRRQAGWNITSEPWKGTVVEWIKYQKKYPDTESVLLNAIPCTAAEYKWLKDNT